MNDRALADVRRSTIHLAELLGREHAALGDFLVALAEFDLRQEYRVLGHASLFDFLLRELRLSRGAAHYRKVAARLVARFPEVVEPLRDGRLCLSAVLELARVMTDANRADVLPRFFHCKVHNLEAARREYGDELMDRWAGGRRGARFAGRIPTAREPVAGYGVAGPGGSRPGDACASRRGLGPSRPTFPASSRAPLFYDVRRPGRGGRA